MTWMMWSDPLRGKYGFTYVGVRADNLYVNTEYFEVGIVGPEYPLEPFAEVV